MTNEKHYENLKDAINLMRFANAYCNINADILELFDVISKLTSESDFDFEIAYKGYGNPLDFTVWIDNETVRPYINLWKMSDFERKEFCNKFNLPCIEWVEDTIQISEKVASGEVNY